MATPRSVRTSGVETIRQLPAAATTLPSFAVLPGLRLPSAPTTAADVIPPQSVRGIRAFAKTRAS